MNDNMIKYFKGDIFSPNRTGHECIVCLQTSCKGIQNFSEELPEHNNHFSKDKDQPNEKSWKKRPLGSVKYHPIKHNGYDFLIAAMFVKHCSRYIDFEINQAALREALHDIYLLAKSLPARTLTTVRIPYKLHCKIDESVWTDILNIISEELVEKNIPVEIWQIENI